MIVKAYRKDLKHYIIKKEVKDFDELDEVLKYFMRNEKVKKCKFVLEGEAELKKVKANSMTALFG